MKSNVQKAVCTLQLQDSFSRLTRSSDFLLVPKRPAVALQPSSVTAGPSQSPDVMVSAVVTIQHLITIFKEINLYNYTYIVVKYKKIVLPFWVYNIYST